MRALRLHISIILLIFTALSLLAQNDNIVLGHVYDKYSKLPVEGAFVRIKDTDIGTYTDKEGFFTLHPKQFSAVITVTLLGYASEELELKKSNAIIEIYLSEVVNELEEFVVLPGENPADRLMKAIRKRKDSNNYETEDLKLYSENTTWVAIDKLNKKGINNRLFYELKKGIITLEDSTDILPCYYSTNQVLIQNNRYNVIATQSKSIVLNRSDVIKPIVERLPTTLNFYNNNITILDKNFVSPLSSAGDIYYKFYIKDSISTELGKQYLIRFRPDNIKYAAFKGDMLIDSASLSLVKIEAELQEGVNINLIKRIAIKQELVLNVPRTQELIINMQATSNDKLPGNNLFIKRQFSFSATDKLIGDSVVTNIAPTDSFSMVVDSISKTRQMRVVSSFVDLMLNKYFHVGKIDIGPFPSLVSINKLEGTRLQLGTRTGKRLSPNMTFGGYAGYGFGSKDWNYGGEFQYRFKQSDYAVIGLKYNNTIYQSDHSFTDEVNQENAVMGGLVGMTPNADLALNRRININLFFELKLSNSANGFVSALNERVFASNYFPIYQGNTPLNSIEYTALRVRFRYAKNQKVMDEFFHRMFQRTSSPVINFVAEGGKCYAGLASEYYLKIHASWRHYLLIGSAGKFKYQIDAGKVFGAVPMPLLEVYNSFENYGANRLALNFFDPYQFAYDSYVNVHTDLIFNGILFNQIPLIKTLNLREVFSAKFIYGGISNQNQMLPANIARRDAPFLQVGAGISNIFKVLAIESIWQIPELASSSKVEWGLRARFYIDF